jgi:hypothetical protein
MDTTNSTPQFTITTVEDDGQQMWAVYDDITPIPVGFFASQEHAEQFIQTFHKQNMAMSEITSLARTALMGWLTYLTAKYGLCREDLDGLVYMGVENALSEVLPE